MSMGKMILVLVNDGIVQADCEEQEAMAVFDILEDVTKRPTFLRSGGDRRTLVAVAHIVSATWKPA